MALSVREVFFALPAEVRGPKMNPARTGMRVVLFPSPSDLSIRIGHGGSDSQRVRELAKISKRVEEIEDERLDN